MHARSQRLNRGFTLIEMMMVIAIIGVVMSGASIGIGALTRGKLRSACMHVASAARFAYNQSISRGINARLSFDFDKHTMAVEQSESDVTLVADGEDKDELEEGDAVDPWAAAKARVETPLEPLEARSGFVPIMNTDGVALKRHAKHALGDGVRVHKIITPHDKEDRTSGQGAIYFFKGGITEHAVIQLTDTQDNVFSVELHPMTGRATVYNYAYEPTTMRDEESEVRDSR